MNIFKKFLFWLAIRRAGRKFKFKAGDFILIGANEKPYKIKKVKGNTLVLHEKIEP